MQNKSNSDKTNLSKANHAKTDAEYVWKQVEDVLVPRLGLSVIERAIYYHLLRQSRLEQKVRYQFSIAALGRRMNLSLGPIRRALHRLMDLGALRLIRRSKSGHVIDVRVPEEIRAARSAAVKFRESAHLSYNKPQRSTVVPLDEIDFLQTKELRRAIHAREAGHCFYCLRRQSNSTRTLDHVVARSLSRDHSYRNLVSACIDCNSTKGEKRAEDFLRRLYRERRLTVIELRGRIRALKSLAAGKLRPPIQEQEK